ncbi:hypothetical protein CSPX01_09237 [Colletotrichum filicis]|nr:hypothetical protein CSPX01_09237 [Colletotrichum filicis]
MAFCSTQVSFPARHASPLRISEPDSFRVSKGWHSALFHMSESSELPKNRGRALFREKKYRSRDVESFHGGGIHLALHSPSVSILSLFRL